MELLERLKDAQKTAMKQKDKARLGTLRLVMAAIKQQEVDTRQSLSDDEIQAVLTKNVKQRRDSVAQYQAAGRDDLAETELAEIAVIEEFLPHPLSDDEVDALVKAAVEQSGASSMQDMGKVMGVLKPQVQGRADMGKVSQRVKAHLG
ncbi:MULTISPECIES: GatB/YqeY domain-containing protein [unclassified Salinivibrio]|uniref:GatB/YqeY domain-containing protein n=1 Tax=unclassified Salinivibrio TaxID=2636825 RepID=UPI00128C76FB|nr:MULTISPECIES: GatB/YqeY domain-containing protein [unclassified Salinivibrio]MPS33423.1 GatB/YqeY domain-containing protein [Salinivibrio sp. VYel7]MPX91706.1 GatB/YqeY domain-containing protein [Salinivibrio sp. VYel1]MPX94807.1 GatB/YqeY domain-containing protein [Salinivibrio sp. VYel9]MPX97576.1 GatB/YqeY domain-containing protein [Salinivibrio sp. VYel6]MPY01094.1 GatB/YqeY domain-containing protein [Salinivibrio sp. VYel4]